MREKKRGFSLDLAGDCVAKLGGERRADALQLIGPDQKLDGFERAGLGSGWRDRHHVVGHPFDAFVEAIGHPIARHPVSVAVGLDELRRDLHPRFGHLPAKGEPVSHPVEEAAAQPGRPGHLGSDALDVSDEHLERAPFERMGVERASYEAQELFAVRIGWGAGELLPFVSQRLRGWTGAEDGPAHQHAVHDIAADHRYEEIEKAGAMTDVGALRFDGNLDASGVVLVPSVLQPVQQLESGHRRAPRIGRDGEPVLGLGARDEGAPEPKPSQGQGVDQRVPRELPSLGTLG